MREAKWQKERGLLLDSESFLEKLEEEEELEKIYEFYFWNYYQIQNVIYRMYAILYAI